MLRSMTGFGAASGQVEGVEFTAEVRSVNNRYFKPNLRLPECFPGLETAAEKLLRRRVARGSLTLALRMKVPDEWAAYRVNTAALQTYLEQLRPLEVEADPTLRIDLGSLLQLPGVCEPPELASLAERTHDDVLGLIEQAVGALIEMRATEGEQLRADLEANCKAIEDRLSEVRSRAPQVVSEYHQRLRDRVDELTRAGNVNVDADQLAREVAIFAERCDIAEEVSRLAGHLEQFREAMDGQDPCGRKLDFISQEMLREANTMASKSNDAEIAKAVVDIKTGIDRVKEQVQNVE